jgi:hypothetical protein
MRCLKLMLVAFNTPPPVARGLGAALGGEEASTGRAAGTSSAAGARAFNAARHRVAPPNAARRRGLAHPLLRPPFGTEPHPWLNRNPARPFTECQLGWVPFVTPPFQAGLDS